MVNNHIRTVLIYLIIAAVACINTELANAMGRDRDRVAKIKGHIVFNSDSHKYGGGVFLLDNGKIEKIIQGGGGPQFSADGNNVIYASGNIFSYSLLTKETKVIRDLKQYEITGFDISPDGKQIVFESRGESYDSDIPNNLFMINIDGTGYKQITFFTSPKDWGARGADHPRWSTDGKSIVFSGPAIPGKSCFLDAIYTINSDGSDLERVIAEDRFGVAQAPCWSPGGKKIAFHAAIKNREHTSRQIFMSDADGSNIVQVTKDERYNNTEPVFSPDGTQIAYASPRHGDPVIGAELFVINVDGTNEARITPPEKFINSFGPWKYATDSNPDWHE